MKDWTKHEEAKRLRDSGMTFKAIGAEIGVNYRHVGSMLKRLAIRNEYIAEGLEYPESKPTWWDGLDSRIAYELQDRGFYSREACMFFAGDEFTLYRGSVVLPGWDQEKNSFGYSDKKITLSKVNKVRAWLGVNPYVPGPRLASDAELDRARRLLERHGWRVEPPPIH